jgi:hypothetical protein
MSCSAMNPVAKTNGTTLRKLLSRIILPIIAALITLNFFLCHKYALLYLVGNLVYLKNKLFRVEEISGLSRDSNMFLL